MDDNIYVVMEYLKGDDGGFPIAAFYSKTKADAKADAWNAMYSDSTYTVVAVPMGG